MAQNCFFLGLLSIEQHYWWGIWGKMAGTVLISATFNSFLFIFYQKKLNKLAPSLLLACINNYIFNFFRKF
ncbi:hypothetical protein C7N43_22460 [Sphingobacteriales bacterium UPWRP_1]|nr:hypothetical protein B6N25_06245 [Sphingobacteriales bacterium TSM_CSS]PSJ74712.1 hypothetical protein C7N43_22460 [Sphingobacteriales bacterium UPWRP_1]